VARLACLLIVATRLDRGLLRAKRSNLNSPVQGLKLARIQLSPRVIGRHTSMMVTIISSTSILIVTGTLVINIAMKSGNEGILHGGKEQLIDRSNPDISLEFDPSPFDLAPGRRGRRIAGDCLELATKLE
jgi:hypothetical protein